MIISRVSFIKIAVHFGGLGCRIFAFVKLFAFELAGQERQLCEYGVWGKFLYETETSVIGKTARLCFFSGQVKRKQLHKYLNDYDTNVCKLYIYIYIYIHTYTHTYIHTYTYIYRHTHTHTHTCTYTCTYTYTYETYTYTYTYTYTCIHACMHISSCKHTHKIPALSHWMIWLRRVYIYIYIYIYIYTYIYTYI